jgi:hypothetical protein
MFNSETFAQTFEWTPTDAMAETWETLTRMPHIRGLVTRQSRELGGQWLASLEVDDELHPLYLKPSRLEAQAAAEGAIFLLDWSAPQRTAPEDLPEPPMSALAATVGWGEHQNRIDIHPVRIGDVPLVEFQAGGMRYILDESQLHRMLKRIHSALRDRLDSVRLRYLWNVCDALKGGASFRRRDESLEIAE